MTAKESDGSSQFVWCTQCDTKPHLRHDGEKGYIVACECPGGRVVSGLSDEIMYYQAPPSWRYGDDERLRKL